MRVQFTESVAFCLIPVVRLFHCVRKSDHDLADSTAILETTHCRASMLRPTEHNSKLYMRMRTFSVRLSMGTGGATMRLIGTFFMGSVL